MKKFKASEFMFEVFSLIVIVIIVQGFYATVVRPQAAAVAASDAEVAATCPSTVFGFGILAIHTPMPPAAPATPRARAR